MNKVKSEDSLNLARASRLTRAFAVMIVFVMVISSLVVLQSPARAESAGDVGMESSTTVPEYMKYIQVNNFKFDPLGKTPDIPELLSYEKAGISAQYYIVQLNGPVTPAMKLELESTGAKILYYINYNAFVVRADAGMTTFAKTLSCVRWAGVFEPAYKISPRLSEDYDEIVERATSASTSFDSASLLKASAPSPAWSSRTGSSVSKTITVNILTFQTSELASVLKAVKALGGKEILYSEGMTGTIQATIDRGMIASLARESSVMWIDLYSQAHVYNDIARWVVQSADNVGYSTPVHDQGIWGTGQVVTLGDSGIDYRHNAFYDPSYPTPDPNARKITDYYVPTGASGDLSDTDPNHGTHTSGTVAGDDGTWHVYDGDPWGSSGYVGPHDGQAFDATIQMQDISPDGYYVYPPPDLGTMYQEAMDRGSYTHTNSWGDSYGSYSDESAQTDTFIWNNQEMVVLFAAANAGSGPGSLSSQSSAKNCIAVGASLNGNDMGSVIYFSGRGPATDGRLKPDVMAPGVDIWSAQGTLPSGSDDDTYWQMSGTSMATPTVAGCAALVRQYYMDGWYPTGTFDPGAGFTPSAALVKATLVNSAREMTGSGAYENGWNFYPNPNQGWGRVCLDDALYFDGDQRMLFVEDNVAGLDMGGSNIYQFPVSSLTEPFEVTLVWSDYPGTPYSSPNLVNDLDLTVIAPNGMEFHGDKYVGYNPGESEPWPSGYDHLNNVECALIISNMQTGVWTVVVDGYNVPMGPQPYALAVTGTFASEDGVIGMDQGSYQSSAWVGVTVVDTGLNVDPSAVDTATATMYSDTELSGEVITLYETDIDTSVFTGGIQLDNNVEIPGDGLLQAQDGDLITAEYYDAMTGGGGDNWVYDYALADDSPPVISDVAAIDVRPTRATITWTTDEPADSVVVYDLVEPPGWSMYDSEYTTSHSLTLTGLTEDSLYYFAVDSMDAAGNEAYDDNSSNFYEFRTPPKPPLPPASEEWPTFHNNMARVGVSPSLFEPPLTQMWSTSTNYAQRWNSPVFSDGMVFSATIDGYLRARDPYTGDVLWAESLGGYGYRTSTPTIADGVLYSSFYTDYGGYVYAIDEYTGETIWSVGSGEIGIDVKEGVAMAYDDGLVFGTGWMSEVFALDAADGSLVWSNAGPDICWSGVSVAYGMVYASVVSGAVIAYDEYSGSSIWTTTLDDAAAHPPLVAEGMVFQGTYGGTMYALDAYDGSVVWSVSGFSILDLITPAFDGASIYFGDFSYNYYSLDVYTGAINWQTNTGGTEIGSALAYANGYLYGAAWDGYLRVLDADTGNIVESHYIGTGSTSSPAISDGWIYIDNNDGSMYAFMGLLPVGLLVSPTSQAQEAVPGDIVTYGITVTNVGTSGDDTFDVTVSTSPLNWPLDLFYSDSGLPLEDTDSDGVNDTGTLAFGESTLIVAQVSVPGAAAAGDADSHEVTFTSSNDLGVSKTARMETSIPPPGVWVGPSAHMNINAGESVLVPMNATNTGGVADLIDLAVASQNGWNVTLLEADGVNLLPDTDGDTFPDTGVIPGLSSYPFMVYLEVPGDATNGTVDRTYVTATSDTDPGATATATVMIEVGPAQESVEWPTFQQNNARNGIAPQTHGLPLSLEWSVSLSSSYGAAYSSPIIHNMRAFYAVMSGDVFCLDLATGNIVWQATLGAAGYIASSMTAAYGCIYVAMVTDTYGYEISMFCLDEETGDVIWQAPYAAPYDQGITTPVVAMGSVYWSSYGNMMVYANEALTGAELWSTPLSGQPLQGPAYYAGMLYLTTLDGGIHCLDAESGAVVWEAYVGWAIYACPVVSDGVLYVADWWGYCYAYDALTGDQIWVSMIGYEDDFSTAVVVDGVLYVGEYDDYYGPSLIAVDATTGTELWQAQVNGWIRSSPAYCNGVVYVATEYGYLCAIDASSGSVLSDIYVSDYSIYSSIAIADGYLLTGDSSGYLFCYEFAVGPPMEVDHIVVTPSDTTVTVGGAVMLDAQAYTSGGLEIYNWDCEWSLSEGLGLILPMYGDYTSAYYVAGTVTGTETVSVLNGSIAGNALVEVVPAAADHMTVSPGVTTMVAGSSMTFTADVWDVHGNLVPGYAADWSVVGGGSIDASGVYTAGTTVGDSTVVATADGMTGNAMVHIVPGAVDVVEADPTSVTVEAGGSAIIEAVAMDQYGNVVPDALLTWTTTGGSVVGLNDMRTIAHMTASTTTGSEQVTVSFGSGMSAVTADVTVTVVPGPVAAIEVTPLDPTVTVGDDLDFSAAAWDAYGNAVTGATIDWDATSGTITAGGVLTAPTVAGQLRVVASSDSISAGVSVIVAPGPVAEVEVWPLLLNITAESSTGLTAAAYDEFGNVVPDATFAWTTTTGSIAAATDTSHATFEAGAEEGSGTITATSGGESGTVHVNVLEGGGEGGTTGTTALTWGALAVAIIAVALAVFMFLMGRKSKKAEGPPPATPPEEPQTPT